MNTAHPKAYMIRGFDSKPDDIASPLHLAPVEDKATLVDFDGGRLSSDAGLLLLNDPDDQLGLTRHLAAVLRDPRDPRRIDFTLHDLLKQRVLHIAAGYEDANDANTLRHDPIFKVLLAACPKVALLWPRNRPSHALKIASHAPNSTAWRGCLWSNLSPLTPGAQAHRARL